jgi:hypothetical protein
VSHEMGVRPGNNRRRLLHILVLLASTMGRDAWAQPSELSTCLSQSEPLLFCEDTHGTTYVDLDCSREFFTYTGRVSWAPLMCVGPVTIELNTRFVPHATRYPIYVQIARYIDSATCEPPGVLVGRVYGGDMCGGTWESVGPIDLPQIIPVGDSYAVQLLFMAAAVGEYRSPGLDCLRVTAHMSSVMQASWSHAKVLFR